MASLFLETVGAGREDGTRDGRDENISFLVGRDVEGSHAQGDARLTVRNGERDGRADRRDGSVVIEIDEHSYAPSWGLPTR